MTREEFYKLTDILNSEVLGSFMHGGEADELIAMFEEAVEHSNILEQEEPVKQSVDEAMAEIEEKAKAFTKAHKGESSDEILSEMRGEEPVSEELESWDKFSHIDDAIEDYCRYDSHIVFFTESLNGEPLEEADDREQVESAFKAGAQWQKSHLWKPADGDDLPEIDREIIALLDNGKVVFAHRPPEYWDGKNIETGKVTRYYPKTYDKGGWNIPDVKWWLDYSLPNMED